MICPAVLVLGQQLQIALRVLQGIIPFLGPPCVLLVALLNSTLIAGPLAMVLVSLRLACDSLCDNCMGASSQDCISCSAGNYKLGTTN